MSIYTNYDECRAAGLDPKKVESISRRMSKIAMEAESMGIVFFGSGEGTLRFRDCDDKGDLIIGGMDGVFDGGAGDERDYGDGLIRGE